MSGLARRLARQQYGQREAGEPLAVQEDEIRVCISSPMMDMCHTVFTTSLLNTYAYTVMNAGSTPISISFNQFGTSILQYSREALAMMATKLGATHMLCLDSDMEFPPDTLLRLLRHGKPFVAANCMARRPPYMLTARDEANKEIPLSPDSSGIEKCNRVGLAVALVSMDIFKAVPRPWFDFEWLPDSPEGDPLITGEDVRFCARARAAGFELYIDNDLSKQVNHHGMFPYNPLCKAGLTQETAK